ncbi:hypothetical protein QC762_0071580 [Podospora pseudocomata]|uniref:Uncharacterized protein n=1 Tax=Podospora pseudocomata TaxID=2093779 RepID=A0ABR0GHB7_9PEZI|nr:hypothetical protein QC762_0071580 [Podospora pseudocomata]
MIADPRPISPSYKTAEHGWQQSLSMPSRKLLLPSGRFEPLRPVVVAVIDQTRPLSTENMPPA